MRKKVQKERCTKIMLTKCKAVCCLYDKVQLAAAKMLDAPECMDTVWLYENGTYSAFDLVQKAYLGKSLAEIADAQQLEKVERTDWKKQELQAQLDLMSDIQAIADRSERTMPDRSNISKQIQRNRSTARKQESVSLMDLLAEQQEDDFDAR